MILALDSGTTSTRASLLDSQGVIASHMIRLGARDQAGTSALLRQVRKLCDTVLTDAGFDWPSVEAIVAFGMITSEHGLEEITHLRAPLDIGLLANSMQFRWYREVLPVPVWLVPGVVSAQGEDPTDMDVMRGEETEVAGLLTLALETPPLLFVSPGSHTKFVMIGPRGRIEWSVTTLSGEILWALHRETILRDLISPTGETHPEWVRRGAAATRRSGLTRSLFSTRLLNLIGQVSADHCSSFVHGAIAQADVDAVASALRKGDPVDPPILISGNGPLAAAYEQLFREEDWVGDVRLLSFPLGSLGAWELHRLAHSTHGFQPTG
jgi:2-dehydro-3-deoxygalactonokinase